MASKYKNKGQVSVVGDLIAPKAPKPTRDHQAANRQMLKQMEELTILRKEQAEMDAVEKPAFALAKFGNVESKLVKEHGLTRVAYHGPSGATERTLPLGGTNRANTQTHQFLQRKPVAEKDSALPKPFIREETVHRKPEVPKARETVKEQAAKLIPHVPKDYLHANATHAIHAIPRRVEAVDPSAPLPKHEEYGATPAYLRERQARWQEEEQRKKKAEEEARLCPPGHRMLPEEERVETLAALRATVVELRAALARMPLKIELPSALRRQQEMEEKLKRIETAIGMFEKPRVYVKIGTPAGGF